MRGGKDEEQVMSPVFPRFHVKDTEKGGPRAPPRNKMALYERFSIPSQSVTSMLPFRDNNSSSLVPSTCWSDVSIHKRNIFTPACNSLGVPSVSAEKIQSYAPSADKLNTMMSDCERISTKPSNYLNPTSSTSTCDSFQPKISSNCRKFSLKKFGNEDDLGVPTSVQGTALQCRNSQQSKERESLSCSSSTVRLESSCSKQVTGSHPKTRQCGRNHDEENPKVSQVNKDPLERSVALSIAKDFANASSSPTNADKHPESLKRTHGSTTMSEENRSSVNDLNRLHRSIARSQKESMTVYDKVAIRDGILVQSRRGTDEDTSSEMEEKSGLMATIRNDNRVSDRLENDSEFREENCGVVRVGNLTGHEVASDMSTMNNPAVGVSPDDVIGVIGSKQFFKTREAIVHQRRVFALQLFELHRLIKVQRLIAGSPNLLLEGNDFLGRPAVKVPLVKKVSLEHALEPPPLIVKPKDCPQKRNSSRECAEESDDGKFPLPSVNRGLVTQQSNYDQYPNTTPSASGTTNSKPPLWGLQPPDGNMWFVPVMSSADGLACRPYTGQCPPAGSFMAPMSGSYGPPSINAGTKDYVSAGYGVPCLNQQAMRIGTPPFLQSYFPPYGLPIINQLSFGETNYTLAHQSSCNMSSQTRQVISCHGRNIQASERDELQGSTSSSSALRTMENVLPCFPMTPQLKERTQNAQTSEHQTRPIKVIPHNTKSASSESAARILLSIQEERK